jgi:hypothetical protein
MNVLLALLPLFILLVPVYGGLGWLIWIDYRARTTFTPGEAAIFREMRRVLDEAK